MTTGATHAPASSAATAPHHERDEKRAAAGVAKPQAAREAREVDRDDVEHRKRKRDKQHGNAEVEPGRRVDRAEGSRRQNHREAEHAVHDRHRRPVRAAEHEPAAPRAGLRAGADDRQVDGNHRQNARRQVEREPADEHQQENRERPAALEQTALMHPVLGVVHLPQELAGAHVPAETVAGLHEVVQTRDAGIRRPGARPGAHACRRG
jgi:hypothetical protein